jgi:hypothetical protein
MRNVLLGLCFIGASIAACGGSNTTNNGFGDTSDAGSSGSSGSSGGSSGLFSSGGPITPDAAVEDECTKMDLVFIVDNSGSMSQEQASLRTNFPKFIQVIESYRTKQGRELDFRVAVTSTDASADRGRFRTNGAISRQWLERSDPNLAMVFGQRAEMGTGGSPSEEPLETLKLSLVDRIADRTNGDFLRADALLAVVILTDEDVAGRKAVDAYISDLDGVKAGKRERWASAVIAGPTPLPSGCPAASARQLQDYTTKVGANGVFSSICDADLSGALTQAVQKFSAACKTFNGPR